MELKFRGQVEGIGVAPRIRITNDRGSVAEDRTLRVQGFDHAAATRDVATGETLVLAATGVFVFIGLTPNTGYLRDKLPLDDADLQALYRYVRAIPEPLADLPGDFEAQLKAVGYP